MATSPGSRVHAAWLVVALVVVATAGSHAQSTTAFERGWRSGTPATVTGTVTAIVGDDFARGSADIALALRDERSGRLTPLKIDSRSAQALRVGQRITVSGRLHEGDLYILASSDDPSAAPAALTGMTLPVTPAAEGDQRTLVMTANFSDTALACTAADVDNAMFHDPSGLSVDALYRSISYGRLSFSGSVVGPYTLEVASTDACHVESWAAALDARAAADGMDLSSYARKVYVMPPNACPAAGYGTMSSTPSSAWVFTCNLKGVFAHELGHNLGLNHASTPTAEYGDMTDPLSAGSSPLRGMNAPHRHQLGWLAGSAVPVTQSGLYEVSPLTNETSTAATPRALLVTKQDTGEQYYLSYRLPDGFDNYIDSNLHGKVSIHRYQGDGSPTRTYRLAGLADGERFSDDANGISITHVSHDNTRALVQVDLSHPCVKAAPSVTLSPGAPVAPPGGVVSYSITVANQDSAACPSTTWSIGPQVPGSWTGLASPASLTLAAGATGQAVLSVTSPAGAFDGTYPVAVAATDGAAGHSASATGSYVVSTPCTPVAPTFSAAPTSQNGVPGTTRSYAVTVFNHDSSTCPNATLAVQGLLPSGWSGAPSASSITLVPGASAGLTLTVTPSAQAAAGAYDLTLRVADNLTPVHTSGAGLTFVVQVPSDTTVPTTPTGLTASVSQKLKQVKLSWKASSDNVAVTGYRVSRHGALVATTTSTTWTDTTWIGGATYAYTVTATDAAGNVSSAATATVTLGGGGKGGR